MCILFPEEARSRSLERSTFMDPMWTTFGILHFRRTNKSSSHGENNMKIIALVLTLICSWGSVNAAVLYAMNSNSISKIAPVTGDTTFLSLFDVGGFDGALAYGQGSLYAMNSKGISVIDTTTGNATYLSSFGTSSYGGGLVYVSQVPAPGATLLFSTGLLTMFSAGYRRSRCGAR